MTLNSVSSTRRQAGAEYLLLDSGAQLHACPLTYPGQKIPLLDPRIHTASGARKQHDGGRLVTYKLPEGRTIRVLFHACAVQKQILSLVCLAQQEYWSDLRADAGTLFFPDKTQTNRSHTQLHKEESLFFVKWMLVAPLTTAGVSDKVAQEIQMPVGPQMLEDVEEPMLAIVSNLEDVIRHIENSRKSMQLCLHFSLIEGTWEMWKETPLLEPYARRWCQTPRTWTCSTLSQQQPSGCVTWGIHRTQKINDINYSQLISDSSTCVKKRAQRSDESISLRRMDDVVGTRPDEHLMSDFIK